MASFLKSDRLNEVEAISLLFDRSGQVVKVYPLIFIIREYDFSYPSSLKVLFSVPKKRVKLAVNRNLIKRRFRECHKEQIPKLKSILLPGRTGVALGVLFVGKEIPSYQVVENSYKSFIEKCSKNNR